MRNVSDQRGDLLEYVKQQKWNEIEAVSNFFAPYSYLGNVLAVVGTIGYAILVSTLTCFWVLIRRRELLM